MTIAAQRAALASALESITGLRATALVTDQVNTNQAVVSRGEVEYDVVFGAASTNTHTYHYTVTVFVNRTPERASQETLDALCDPTDATSVKVALEATAVATAAGADYIRVLTASAVQVATVGAIDYLTVDFEIEVCA